MLAVGTVLLDAVVVMVLSMVNTELGCGVLRPGGSSAFSKSDVLLLNVGYTAVVVVGVFVIGCVGGGRVGEQYIVVVDGTKESILVKDKKKRKFNAEELLGWQYFLVECVVWQRLC